MKISQGDKVKIKFLDGSTIKGTVNRILNRTSGSPAYRVDLNKPYGDSDQITAFTGPQREVGEKITHVLTKSKVETKAGELSYLQPTTNWERV